MNIESEKRVLTREEVSELYELSDGMQRRLRADMCLPYIKIGARILYDRHDLEDFLIRYKVNAMPAAQPEAEVAP